MAFTKLDEGIVLSTIWREPDHVLRVWITMLARKNRHGEVEASIPGLAGLALVTVEQCEDALARFKAPDKYSRTQTYDGRRIEDIPGGWYVLNHEKYKPKDGLSERKAQDAERQRRHRERVKADLEPQLGDLEPEPRHVMSRDKRSGSRDRHKKGSDVGVKMGDGGGTTKTTTVRVANANAPFVTAWSEKHGEGTGTDIAPRIGSALKRLRKRHDDAKILDQWLKYLKQTEVDYTSPQTFVNKFGSWTGRKDKSGKQERTKEGLTNYRELRGVNGDTGRSLENARPVQRALPHARSRDGDGDSVGMGA